MTAPPLRLEFGVRFSRESGVHEVIENRQAGHRRATGEGEAVLNFKHRVVLRRSVHSRTYPALRASSSSMRFGGKETS